MSVVVSQAKLGISVGNYSDMNEYSRRVLSRFDKDMRMSAKVTAMTETEVTVVVVDSVLDWTTSPPKPGAEKSVRYFYQGNRLYRQSPAGAVGSAPDGNCEVLLSDLRHFRFGYFNTEDTHITDYGNTASVRKILLSGTLQRSFSGLANTDYLVSAVVVMRSKPGSRL